MLAVKSMYMEEQPVVKPHRLTMQNRSTIQVTGVSDVIAYATTTCSARRRPQT